MQSEFIVQCFLCDMKLNSCKQRHAKFALSQILSIREVRIVEFYIREIVSKQQVRVI